MATDGTAFGPDREAVCVAVASLLQCLSNTRRIAVLGLLADDQPRSVSELVREIARMEQGGDPEREHRKSVYVSLIQLHLSTMDDTGVIEYDDDRKTVERGPAFDRAWTALDSAADVVDANGDGGDEGDSLTARSL